MKPESSLPYPQLGMWRVWGREDVYTGFWWGSLRERDHWGDPDVDRRIILRWILRKWEGVVGTRWTCPYPEPASSSPHTPLPLPEDPS
jgi:hypothetical protein